MGALADYKAAWAAYRSKVKELRGDYDKRLAALEQHQGSAYGDERMAELERDHGAKMAAARSDYGERMGKVLERMKDNSERREQEVVPPTDEQLRTLEAVRMMTTVTPSDYQRYAEQMEGSDVASRALHDMASERMPEGVKLPEYKGPHGRAWQQAKALSASAKNLARWDGDTDRGAALRGMIQGDKDMGNLRGVGTDSSRRFHSVAAAEVDPTSKDFFRELIGLDYDEATLQLLD